MLDASSLPGAGDGAEVGRGVALAAGDAVGAEVGVAAGGRGELEMSNRQQLFVIRM